MGSEDPVLLDQVRIGDAEFIYIAMELHIGDAERAYIATELADRFSELLVGGGGVAQATKLCMSG